jgi:hypothetical protein
MKEDRVSVCVQHFVSELFSVFVRHFVSQFAVVVREAEECKSAEHAKLEDGPTQ